MTKKLPWCAMCAYHAALNRMAYDTLRTSCTHDGQGAEENVIIDLPRVAPNPNSVLTEAARIVHGPRRRAYGHPRDNFKRIANLWNAYLEGREVGPPEGVGPQDVALMFILVKVARLMETPNHRDSLVDICGYAATIEMLWETGDV